MERRGFVRVSTQLMQAWLCLPSDANGITGYELELETGDLKVYISGPDMPKCEEGKCCKEFVGK